MRDGDTGGVNASMAGLADVLRQEIEHRARAEAERDVLRRQLSAAEEAERHRLARELHDQLGQQLTALALGFEALATVIPEDSPAGIRIDNLLHLARTLTRDIRYFTVELHPPELVDFGLDSALSTYVREWSHRYGARADLEITGADGYKLPFEVRTAVYRITQEALTNVARHGRATEVSVILRYLPGEVHAIIEDDGAGFDVESTLRVARSESRLGLAGMRERARLLGGTVSIESAVGSGTTVVARIPLAPPQPGVD